MRILVISDSHGGEFKIRQAVSEQPKAKMLIFLGDGLRDLDNFDSLAPDMTVLKVRGNCDFYSTEREFIVDEVEGVRLYCTHGYRENVKSTKSILRQTAADNKAHIALYGHTHIPDTTYDDGVWLINPGSIRDGSYAVIDISEKGILPALMKLRC
ncbi:MAG: YfcE family phosphodiesterase [Clostridia bacterium]|nr:YfcE family phosphodiesterase [Clostridia bacterium]